MIDQRVIPINPDNLTGVRLSWLSAFDHPSLSRYLSEARRPAFWLPDTGEYAIGSHWRGRTDIGQIVEIGGRRHRQALVEHLIEGFRDAGCGVVLLSVNESWRETRWYRQNGFHELDRIVTMIQANVRPVRPSSPTEPMTIRGYDPADLAKLTAVDRSSFPWLWWNDPAEFDLYRQRPDVLIRTGWVGRTMVAYAAATLRPGRGHLDRLAVREQDQGKGFGRVLLEVMINEMANEGAREIGLTTQTSNEVAQILYRRFGFRVTHEVEPILGQWLGAPHGREHAQPTGRATRI